MTRPAPRRPAIFLALAALASVLSLVSIVATSSVASANTDDGIGAISAGERHTCAITARGAVRCWGESSWDKLGTGTPTNGASPRQVAGLTEGVTALSAGDEHTCAVVDGAVKCWGQFTFGRLGDGTAAQAAGPVQVVGITSGATEVASGGLFSCALVADGVQCWGSNTYGELGNGTTTQSNVPVEVDGLGPGSGVTSISAGRDHACAVTPDGLVCWGRNSSGQLGDGTTAGSLVPRAVSGLDAGSGVRSVSAGDAHTCAVVVASARCWGSSSNGRLGIAGTVGAIPTQVVGLTSGVSAIDAGAKHTCAVVSRAAMCWGSVGESFDGAVGDGTDDGSSVPVQVAGLTSGVTSITASEHTCALVSQEARCWGRWSSRQLASSWFGSAQDPVAMGTASGPAVAVTAIDVGVEHACAVATGAASCTGENRNGELGNGFLSLSSGGPFGTAGGTDRLVPVSGLGSGVTDVAVGADHSCAVVSGAARCWGTDAAGQLGSTSTTSRTAVPVPVLGLSSGVTAISAGGSTTCAVVAGAGACWGANTDGLLGTGTTATRSDVPAAVSGLTSGVTAIDVGATSACAVVAGAAVCWGANGVGQLGDGSTTPSSVPVPVEGLTSGVTDVSVGEDFACAVVSGGVRCWGANDLGQLGNGSSAATLVATQVSGLTADVTDLSLGADHACAAASGGLTCWGYESFREFATGAPAGIARTPVSAASLSSGVTVVATGGHTTCVARAGEAICAGDNREGQTGDGVAFHPKVVLGDFVWARRDNRRPPTATPQAVAANAPTTPTTFTLTGWDPDGDRLTYGIGLPPSKGALTCTWAGACTYIPKAGATGADSFTFWAYDEQNRSSSPATVSLAIDSSVPGVFVGAASKMEPESGASSARGMVIPVTLSQPAAYPLTVRYWTSAGTATDGADYARWGTAAAPRSLTIPAGSTHSVISVPVRDDDLVEGDETFQVHVSSVTGGPAYLVPTVIDATIRDADSVERSDASVPILSMTSVSQAEGNAATPTRRKAQVRLELSKPLATPLSVRWSTLDGTAVGGTDFTARSNVLATFKPGQTELSLDLTVLANDVPQPDRAFRIGLSSITGGDVAVADPTATVTIVDEDS